jgi:hypothetical protein
LASFRDERLRGRAVGCGERDGRQGADELGGQAGGRLARWPAWRRRAGGGGAGGWDEAGQGAPPGDEALACQHAQAERERLAAGVQGGMAKLLVAGVQPAAGSGSLAGIQAGAWFSSRVAR